MLHFPKIELILLMSMLTITGVTSAVGLVMSSVLGIKFVQPPYEKWSKLLTRILTFSMLLLMLMVIYFVWKIVLCGS